MLKNIFYNWTYLLKSQNSKSNFPWIYLKILFSNETQCDLINKLIIQNCTCDKR